MSVISCDLWGFWWVERGCMFDGVRKCVLKMIYNNFDWVYRREVFLLVNRKVSNWIVFREKSDNFLKCLWFSCDLWWFWWVERKCMLDGVHNVCWRYFRIYLLHLEARSLLIGKSQCQIELCSARSLIIFWNVCDLVVISEDFDGYSVSVCLMVYIMCVDNTSEYIYYI